VLSAAALIFAVAQAQAEEAKSINLAAAEQKCAAWADDLKMTGKEKEAYIHECVLEARVPEPAAKADGGEE
jgi:hypothetical protein